MAKVKVEVLDAVVDGKGKGAKLEIDERSAKHLAAINYVRIVQDAKQPKQTKQAKSKKSKSNDK